MNLSPLPLNKLPHPPELIRDLKISALRVSCIWSRVIWLPCTGRNDCIRWTEGSIEVPRTADFGIGIGDCLLDAEQPAIPDGHPAGKRLHLLKAIPICTNTNSVTKSLPSRKPNIPGGGYFYSPPGLHLWPGSFTERPLYEIPKVAEIW